MRSAADAERLAALGLPGLQPLVLDVTDDVAAAAGLEEVGRWLAAGGLRLAALVNNAGVNPEGRRLQTTPFEAAAWPAEPAVVEATLAVNVVGLLRVTRLALPLLRRDGGRVVNVGSYFGSFAPLGLTQLAYAASKHGVEALSDGLRRGLAADGVAVSLVKPGNFKTGMNLIGDDSAVEVAAAVRDAIASPRPLPRCCSLL